MPHIRYVAICSYRIIRMWKDVSMGPLADWLTSRASAIFRLRTETYSPMRRIHLTSLPVHVPSPLSLRGVGVRSHYAVLPLQPVMCTCRGCKGEDVPCDFLKEGGA